jgi:hypothetical protein
MSMGRRVQNIRELIRAARALRSAADGEPERAYIETLLRTAAELEERATLLANARPDEMPEAHNNALHASIDILV